MRQGNLQVSPQNYADTRVVRSVHMRPPSDDDEGESLVVSVIQRRWKLLMLCCMLSVAAGAYCYVTFSLPQAISEAKMLFKPLPPTAAMQFEDPLQPLTIAEMAVSDENLHKLAKMHDISISIKSLRKCFDVQANRYVKIITITLKWENAQKAIDMVNDLMTICSDQVVEQRREYLIECQKHQDIQLAEVDAKIADSKQKVLQLQKTVQSFMAQHGQEGTQNALLINQLSTTEANLNNATIERKTLEHKLSRYRTEIVELEESLRAEVLSGKLAQYNARKSRQASLTPRMKQLKKEIDDFNTVNASLDYQDWKSKIDVLGNELLDLFPNPSLTSINIRESELSKLRMEIRTLEFSLQTQNDKIKILASRLEQDRRKLVTTSGTDHIVMSQLDEAKQNLNDLREQKKGIVLQKSTLKHLADSTFRELIPHAEASPDTTEHFDGKKKIFALAFAGTFVVLILPVFALEHFFPSISPAELFSKDTGMTVVGRNTFVVERLNHHKSHHPLNSESLRLLALRIQQSVQSPGAMVLFSGLNHESTAIPTLTYLGECLARREERVLIIDACDRVAVHNAKKKRKKQSASMAIAHQPPPSTQEVESQSDSESARELVNQYQDDASKGLSEFLNLPNIDPKDLICPTDIPGVDIIPSGSSEFPSEAFGSRKINDLFDVCRQEYTMILVSGPSTSHPSDLQMLSARADGILFTVPNHSRRKGGGKEVIEELRDLGAPIIGIVS